MQAGRKSPISTSAKLQIISEIEKVGGVWELRGRFVGLGWEVLRG